MSTSTPVRLTFRQPTCEPAFPTKDELDLAWDMSVLLRANFGEQAEEGSWLPTATQTLKVRISAYARAAKHLGLKTRSGKHWVTVAGLLNDQINAALAPDYDVGVWLQHNHIEVFNMLSSPSMLKRYRIAWLKHMIENFEAGRILKDGKFWP